MAKDEFLWLVAYIHRNYIDMVERDLNENGFGFIIPYIPTVRILKKKFKGKSIFEKVPLLFNYGFFKIPYNYAVNEDFLINMRTKVRCIYSWVRDPIRVISKKPNLNIKNKGIITDKAIVSEKEIVDLIKTSEYASVFSNDVVDKLKPGNTLILKGYPYEGMMAEVMKINKNRKEVKVKILLETMTTQVTVNFENIFYTVYSDYDPDLSNVSIDELELKGKRILDKIYAKINYE